MARTTFQEITLELNRLANLFNKTHDKKYKLAWYKLLEKIKFMWYLTHMAKYKGRTVRLNKPSRGDVKKFKVFVKDRSTGRIKKVNFGSKTMSIKKNIPARQRSFFARFRPILAKVKGQKNLSPAYWAIQSWKKGFRI